MHQYGIKEIEYRTGLKRSFINKCNRRLNDILSRFRIAGDKGALLYDDGGLRVWDTIKQHKERGEDITQIRKALEQFVHPDDRIAEPGAEGDQPSIETQSTKPDNRPSGGGERHTNESIDIDAIVLALNSAHKIALDEMGKRMNLLEEGKQQQQQREQGLRDEITDLKAGAQRENHTRGQRVALLNELQKLEGKWGKGRRRRRFSPTSHNSTRLLNPYPTSLVFRPHISRL